MASVEFNVVCFIADVEVRTWIAWITITEIVSMAIVIFTDREVSAAR